MASEELNGISDPRDKTLTGPLEKGLGPSRNTPDLEDLRRRIRHKGWMRRLSVGFVGVAVGALSVVIATSTLRTGVPELPSQATNVLPEGKWLIRGTTGASLFPNGDSVTSTNVWVQDYSEERGQFLALTETVTIVEGLDPGTGTIPLTRRDSLVMVRASDGKETVLASLPANATFGEPARWSPDGRYAIVKYAEWGQDVVEGAPHPGPAKSRTICTVEVDTRALHCFDALSPITNYSPHPTQPGTVVLARGASIETLDIATGRSTTLLTPDALDEALGEVGLGEIYAITQLEWAPSGRFLGILATATRAFSVPLVLDTSGGSLTVGEANDDNQAMAWSPVEDLLAYGTGIAPEDVQPSKTSELHFLDPESTVEQTVDLGTDVFVADLDWSPSGRWLAVSGSPWGATENVLIVDVSAKAVRSRVILDQPAELSPLVEWVS